MQSQADADAATVLRAAERLRGFPELADELRRIARRIVGRVDAKKPPSRAVQEHVVVNGRTVMIVTRRRAQFGLV